MADAKVHQQTQATPKYTITLKQHFKLLQETTDKWWNKMHLKDKDTPKLIPKAHQQNTKANNKIPQNT